MTTVSDPGIRLSFPARAEYLILARLALAGVGRAVAIDEEVLADLKLAVTEACGNAVRHAYAGLEEGAVRVAIDVGGDEIVVTVSDDGRGVTSPGADSENGDAHEGGMGLAIIGAIADELDVRRAGPEGGTVVRMVKRL